MAKKSLSDYIDEKKSGFKAYFESDYINQEEQVLVSNFLLGNLEDLIFEEVDVWLKNGDDLESRGCYEEAMQQYLKDNDIESEDDLDDIDEAAVEALTDHCMRPYYENGEAVCAIAVCRELMIKHEVEEIDEKFIADIENFAKEKGIDVKGKEMDEFCMNLLDKMGM